MIEEDAFVVCVEADGYAWIETRRLGACKGCDGGGCGAASFARWMRPRLARIRALDPIESQAGDTVVVGIHEQALLKGSFAVYIVPLICMLSMVLLGGHFSAGNTHEDVISLMAGLLGLGAGIVWLFHFARKSSQDNRYQPVILRRKTSQEIP
jgi:sigma-E factor negative regulatory protein RseC